MQRVPLIDGDDHREQPGMGRVFAFIRVFLVLRSPIMMHTERGNDDLIGFCFVSV